MMNIQRRLGPQQAAQNRMVPGCDASQHYTMLFNAFVVMTLFNQVLSTMKGEWLKNPRKSILLRY